MEFISLGEVLNSIAARVPVPAEDVHWNAAVYSQAADLLGAAMHNFPELEPRWFERREGKAPRVASSAVSVDGRMMVSDIAGWRRWIDEMGRNVRLWSNRLHEIGFERSAMVALLNANGVEHIMAVTPLDERTFMPLRDFASMLADDQYSDTPEHDAVKILNLAGITDFGSEAPTQILRDNASREYQARIDHIVSAGAIALYDPITRLPTSDLANALVRYGEVVEALKKHAMPSAKQPSVQTVAPAEPAPQLAAAAHTGPLPLTSGDIAFCFDGLHWDEQTWKKSLAKKPKWLAGSVAIPGQQGRTETRWNPVHIGAALVQKGHVKPRSVWAKFQIQQQLRPWFDAWKTYAADYLEIN
jgi:hypothetical protein